jgi:hypothetical protein
MGRATRFAIGLLLYAVALPAYAATITITNTNDSGPGSLRQALAVAHDGDSITFAVSGTITLTSGGLGVFKNVTISGPGTNQLAIDGNQALFAFGVFPQRTVSISGLSIANAQIGVYNNQGALSVSSCVLSGNFTAGLGNDAGQGSGGASMTAANSTISNNEVGISNNQGTVSIINCVLSGNSFTGLYNYATGGSDGASMMVANSIISNNAGEGAINWLPSGGGGCACMTITESVVSNNTNGIFNIGDAFPGAASLTVANSNVSDNNKGGINNIANGVSGGSATATIVSTTVSGNSAGGVFSSAGQGSAGVTITNSTISGNSSHGGINAVNFFPSSGTAANLSVANSTISGNSAPSGGGINASALRNFSIVNSTISGNSAGTTGGGVYNFNSSLNVANSTISGNSAGSGGGIYNDGQFGVSAVEISNTILNVGALGANIFNNLGTITSDGYNLSSDDGGGYLTGPGDQINTDPLLGPLQNNGGPTFTHALLPGSPAIDAGDPNFSPPPLNDQRGCPFDRVSNGRIDIGSFETQLPPRRPDPCPRSHPTPAPRP